MEYLAFLVLAGLALGGAVGVMNARTVFVSALWLILSFMGVAGLYALLSAGFLAVIQVLVYVGAISVLILFAVMLTRHVMEEEQQFGRLWWLNLTFAMCLFGALATFVFQAGWPLASGKVLPADGGRVVLASEVDAKAVVAQGLPAPVDEAGARQITSAMEKTDASGKTTYQVPGSVVMLGRAFMRDHFLAFELASVILLMALVGAIVIARE
jgi:NADH-quinone oxidoreductase subunit J